MRAAWITDLRHFLDAQGEIPPHLPPVARQMAAIVAEVSPLALDDIHVLDLRCRRRPGRRPCRGMINAKMDSSSGEISWHCLVCDDHGCISHWQDTPWDRRSPDHGRSPSSSSADLPGFSARARVGWNRLSPTSRLKLLNNVWCVACRVGTSMAIDGASAAGPDLVLRGTCTKCGGEVARVVEDACTEEV